MRQLTLVAALLLTAPTVAHGQMIKASDFDVRLGGAVSYAPDYLGSNDYELGFAPDAEVVYQKHLFLSSRDGAGVYLFNDAGTKLGVSVSPDFGRDQGDNPHLAGLGDVDFGWNVNIFLDGNFDPFLAGLGVHHEFANGSGGTLVDGYVGYRQMLSERLTGTLKASTTWSDTDRATAYFGVNATQATNSGLPAFGASEGLRDASLSANLEYALTPHVDLTGTARWTRLLGDAADSPVTQDADQIVFLFGAAYSFPVKKWQPPK